MAIATCLGLLVGLGAVVAWRTASGRPPSASRQLRPAAAKGPAPDSFPSPPPADPFELPAVVAYLKSRQGNISAAICNEESHEVFLYRPADQQDTASIVKVDILATLLYQAQQRGSGLSEEDRELATAMIEDSDDDDADDLWIAEGRAAAVDVVNKQLGMTQTDLNGGYHWGLSKTTPADQIKLLNALALPSQVLDPSSQRYELSLMENVVGYQAWGVSTGLPRGATLAIKNGWLPLSPGDWQINSIGIASDLAHTYAIAVMTTEDPTEAYGIDTIDGLARRLWAHLMPHDLAPPQARG
jgi:beta-lactamase class A